MLLVILIAIIFKYTYFQDIVFFCKEDLNFVNKPKALRLNLSANSKLADKRQNIDCIITLPL